jgi:hypothetical protein
VYWLKEELDDSGTRLGENLNKSLQVLVLQCGVARSTSDIGIRMLKLRFYKITTIHGLLPPVCEARIGKIHVVGMLLFRHVV